MRFHLRIVSNNGPVSEPVDLDGQGFGSRGSGRCAVQTDKETGVADRVLRSSNSGAGLAPPWTAAAPAAI